MIVCLDTNIVIYLVESHPIWAPKATARLADLRAAGDEIAVGDVVRLECLIKPFQTGNAKDIATYQKFFVSPLVRMLSTTSDVWERAARMAVAWKFKALDSVHLATAIEHGCGLFFTNDAALARCTDIKVEVLT